MSSVSFVIVSLLPFLKFVIYFSKLRQIRPLWDQVSGNGVWSFRPINSSAGLRLHQGMGVER